MKVLTNNQYYSQIANIIREQNGTNNTYTPPQMVRALKDLFYEEVEGVPPISFNGIGENLLDYRIDGASGGVGARTNNLFDKTKTNRKLNQARTVDGSITYTTTASNFFDYYISVNPNTQYIVADERNVPSRIYFFESDKTWIGRTELTSGPVYPKSMVFTTPSNCYYIQFQEGKDNMMNENTLMLNVGNISLPYEPYGYKVPVVISGKNLFDETQVPDKSISTETSNFQIFKQNGKLIVNGMTVSTQVDTEISKTNGVNNQALDYMNNNPGNYILTSLVPGRIMIRYKQIGSDIYRYTFDEYNSNNKIADRVVFRLQQNYQYNNEDMNIMIKSSKIQSTNYEPYIEPTTTNIYLDNPIEENESISLSDTNVNIPTIRGTNVLSIDTTVQPSNVYIKVGGG